jgi:hypothetical protein
MRLEFTIGRDQYGNFIRSEFEASIDYEIPPIEYRVGPFRIAENIKLILTEYAAIDALRYIRIRLTSPTLTATVILVGSWHRVQWSQENPMLQPLDIIVAGTLRARLPELKGQLRREVRAAAIRRARVMRDNANALLTFLNVPE